MTKTTFALKTMAMLGLPLFLAACGGGGSGSSGSSTPPTSNWADQSYSSNFDLVAAAAYRQSTEFRNSNADCTFYACASSGTPAGPGQADAYGLINVQVAHTAGLTGQNQLIAIVDDGFRVTHQELAGKTIYTYGTLPVTDHGTHVASLAAGKRDGIGMMGVAPDASLHLASIDPAQASILNFANVIGATNDAAAKGAVVQNNSWGFDNSAKLIDDYLKNNPGASLADALAANVGYSASQWASYISALKNFQKTGVIVFAETNKTSFADGTAVSSMAAFDADLQKAWIAVVNGYFEIDANNQITAAARLSGQCGYAATFCLAGDGTTFGAAKTSDTAYAAGTGTSYVAPQVSGAVALLAQAFPSLTPAEWVDRLLASANNTWFPAQGVAVAGSVDFGNGISHKYSTEWGHGVVDIKAALSPIGSLSLLSGGNVKTASRTDLANAGLTSPQSYGDALTRSLMGEKIAVFDALNGNFTVEAGTLVKPAPTADLLSSVTADSTNESSAEAGLGFAHSGVGQTTFGGSTQLGFTQNLAGDLAGPGALGKSSVLSLASNAVAVKTISGNGPLRFDMTAFAGPGQASGQTLSGAGFGVSLQSGTTNIRLGVTQMAETGAVMGLSSSGALSLANASALSTLRIDADRELMPGVKIFGGAEMGLAQPFGSHGDLVASSSSLGFSGLRAGLVFKGDAPKSGRLTLSLAQPVRIESGTANLTLPTGRTKQGDLTYESTTIGLTPSGRELDLGASYLVPLGESSAFSLAGIYALDAGHVAGARAFGISAGLRGRF